MFDRFKSVAYAEKWAYSRNPKYYDFAELGGDCTNFVSQCLHAGGIAMNYATYGWFYVSLNNRAPAWTGVEQFWNFGVANGGAGIRLAPCTTSDLEIADVIQLGDGKQFYHNLLVTKIAHTAFGKRIFLSAHDNDVFNAPLESYSYVALRCAKVNGSG